MSEVKILWADDEIDLLKPHLLFLKNKGYDVLTVTNGNDALEEVDLVDDIDVIFLDESMPGLTGLETLTKIKEKKPSIPIVMITKNEAEDIMEEAIGSQIDDYLIKPVNPNQILLTLKKIIDNKRLVHEKTASDYQMEFRKIIMEINSVNTKEEWANTYKKIINWELKLDDSNVDQMGEILHMQKTEANAGFSKFIDKEYENWLRNPDNAPVMSHTLFRKKVFPLLDDKPTVVFLLDNLRYDQWMVISPIINEYYRIVDEDYFFSILPTSTQYSRNAIFAGMLPGEIAKHFPEWWLNDNDEGGKNMKEAELLETQINRIIRREIKHDYAKITKVAHAKTMSDNVLNYLNNDLTVVVYNFIDMLSHARTEMEVLKELAGDEKAYRSLTKSWFLNSPLWQAFQKLADKNVRVVVTTDHGTIRVKTPSKVIADRDTTTNLRYKVGKNLQYDKKEVLEIHEPEKSGLPRPNMSSKFIFAKNDTFFLYPNNYNYYQKYFNDTFQHGGISLEEMICPIMTLEPR